MVNTNFDSYLNTLTKENVLSFFSGKTAFEYGKTIGAGINFLPERAMNVAFSISKFAPTTWFYFAGAGAATLFCSVILYNTAQFETKKSLVHRIASCLVVVQIFTFLAGMSSGVVNR